MDKVAGIGVILVLTSSSLSLRATAVGSHLLEPAVTPLAHFGISLHDRIGQHHDTIRDRIHFPGSSQIDYQQQEVTRNAGSYATSAPSRESDVHFQASEQTLASYAMEQQQVNSQKERDYFQNVQYSRNTQPAPMGQNGVSQKSQYVTNGQRADLLQMSQSGHRKSPETVGVGTQVSPSYTANAQASVLQRQNLISTSVTGLGLSIMKTIDAENDGNCVVSPFSIALVLALLQQGSEGEAQQQISRALRLTPPQAREQFNALVVALQNRRSRNILNIATSIFVGEEFTISPQYRQLAVQYFSSDLVPSNFRNSELTAQQINDWVSTSTAGNIPYLVSPDVFTESTQIVLANAVYFKGLWNTTFDPQRSVSRPFRLAGGLSKSTTFMHNSGKFQGGREPRLDADWLVMPFEDLQYSLISIVPSASSGVSSLLQLLRAEDLLGFLRSPLRDVLISIPKFKVRIDTDLIRPLNALGVQDIFTSRSGLSALGGSRGGGGGGARVTGALHAAALSVDERGGSAAAATVLAVSTLSLDPDDDEFRFRAERPFLAVLWDNRLAVPLFVAKIADPTLVD